MRGERGDWAEAGVHPGQLAGWDTDMGHCPYGLRVSAQGGRDDQPESRRTKWLQWRQTLQGPIPIPPCCKAFDAQARCWGPACQGPGRSPFGSRPKPWPLPLHPIQDTSLHELSPQRPQSPLPVTHLVPLCSVSRFTPRPRATPASEPSMAPWSDYFENPPVLTFREF